MYKKIMKKSVSLVFFIILVMIGNNLTSQCKYHENGDGMLVRKKALIFGAGGQDGFYLIQFLLTKNYLVHAVMLSEQEMKDEFQPNIVKENLFFYYGDITNKDFTHAVIHAVNPDEIYNLAAQSNVSLSFSQPFVTLAVNAMGVLNILEGIRTLADHASRFFQASTAEIFGRATQVPQTETTPYNASSPYGISKLDAHLMTILYRSAHNLFACNGILYNHESPIRPIQFVTRKITHHVAHYACGEKKVLSLGNLDARRDWGYAKDYVEAMWLCLQQPQPDDYVIASGNTHTVREFVEEAFKCINITIVWQGKGLDEIGINAENGEKLVTVDKSFFRPDEPWLLQGDAQKAQRVLGWSPRICFQDLIKDMVNSDYALCISKHS